MLQLFKFFTNNRIFVLFVILEIFAFIFIIKSHSYHQSKYLNSANAVSGYILKKSNQISSYFSLKSQNIALASENEFLKNEIEKLNSTLPSQNTNSKLNTKYQHISAKIINNPYTKRNNILSIDKGLNDSIKPNMGVVLSNGIVGITLKVSNNFATILSLLNSQTKINAKMKNTHHYGSLEWNGQDYTEVQFVDLPTQANIKKGDTIISGGKSVFFPEGIPIGTVKEYTLSNKTYTNIIINLFADFSALNNVYVVKNTLSEEQLQLESESKNE